MMPGGAIATLKPCGCTTARNWLDGVLVDITFKLPCVAHSGAKGLQAAKRAGTFPYAPCGDCGRRNHVGAVLAGASCVGCGGGA